MGYLVGLNVVGSRVGESQPNTVGDVEGIEVVGSWVGCAVGMGVGEKVGTVDRKTRTAAAVRRDVVVTDANCTLPALELPLLSLKRVVTDSEHEHVALAAVKDTVVHTSVATFRVLDEPATIRPHVGATTNHGQVCVYEYARDAPVQTVNKVLPSGQVLVTF